MTSAPGSNAGDLIAEISDRVGTVTLNRPDARNALNVGLQYALSNAMAALDRDADVDAVIVTGADPAFCAGIDLKALGGASAESSGGRGSVLVDPHFWAPMSKPVIGAINGPAVTGGLELALQCDFLVASDRARFADTHARIGAVPGAGMSVLLPRAVGVRKARQMSLTGRFLDADDALRWGLVSFVVAHDELLAFTRRLAADIVGANQDAVRVILEEYRRTGGVTVDEAWQFEGEQFDEFRRTRFDTSRVAEHGAEVMERGRRETAR